MRLLTGFGILLIAATVGVASDWPQWGGTPARNMAAENAKDLPDSVKVAMTEEDGGEVDVAKSTNVKWIAPLGDQTYGNPVVAGGRVYVGTNNQRPRDPQTQGDHAILLCLDEQTGKLIWQLAIPKLEGGQAVDFEGVGLCSSPAVVGDRVYVLTNRCEVLCVDGKGQIVWRYDMYNELGVFPHQQAAGSVLVVNDRLYTTTSNGVDWTKQHHPAPDAPALVCLDAKTGKLLGEERSGISSRTFTCNWSSPAFGKVGERDMIVFGGGDGFCYAFEPEPVAGVLKEVWRFDCNPAHYKVNPKTNKPIKYGNSKGYSEICATPVIHEGRVYVATGQDPEAGDGAGNLSCIDANGKQVWSYDKIGRSLSTVSVAGGLVYAGDYAGQVHCVDAASGEGKWVHDTEGRIWGSTLVADAKVYVGNEERMLTILAAGPEDNKLGEIQLDGPVYSTPVVANGVMYIATDKTLFALQKR